MVYNARCKVDEGMSDVKKPLLRPLVYTTRSFYIFIGALFIITIWFGYAWWTQLAQGLGVTGMRTPVGSAWGLYIANFIFLIGISHAGIAISAAVRILRLKAYRPIARMAELLTAVSLVLAILNVIFDLGRPDRILNVFLYGRWQSPLLWDFTAITTYLAATLVYLYIAMREDLAICRERFKKRRWFHKWLRFWALGYADTSEERRAHEHVAWWLALFILPIMVSVHTVVSWVYGLLPARPGWYNPFFGPYFTTAAVASGIALIIVIAAIFRRIFRLKEYIRPDIFRGLGNFLAVVVVIYLYFMIAEQVTVRYAGPTAEWAVSQELLLGSFAWIYWPTVILGLTVPFFILFVQAINPNIFGLGRTVFASLLVVITLWVKRVIVIVPSLLHQHLPFPLGTYIPTWVEWSLILGTYAVGVLLYTAFVKLFPILELRTRE